MVSNPLQYLYVARSDAAALRAGIKGVDGWSVYLRLEVDDVWRQVRLHSAGSEIGALRILADVYATYALGGPDCMGKTLAEYVSKRFNVLV